MQSRSRRFLALAPVLVALAAAGYAAAAGIGVTLGPAGPQPATVTVAAGDTVTFTNTDTVAHTITSRRAGLTLTVPAGGSLAQVFASKGKYGYSDHGARRATGSVVVTVPAAASGASTANSTTSASGSLSLRAARSTITWGSRVLLSGTAGAGAVVTLEQHAKGQVGWVHPRVLTASATGAFSVVVTPAAATTYRVSAGKSVSKALTVNVLPRITLRIVPMRARTGTLATAFVRVSPRAAARMVDVKVRKGGKHPWLRIATRIIDRKTGTMSFRFPLESGRKTIRAFVSLTSAAYGYEPGHSNDVNVTGVGPAPAKG